MPREASYPKYESHFLSQARVLGEEASVSCVLHYGLVSPNHLCLLLGVCHEELTALTVGVFPEHMNRTWHAMDISCP